ncbi:MAG: hypothetical protein BMS9Abin25_0062 [Gammaproteobacteria bacterium]|nr:MAG: hypothetical protein BMS9Abin25_0062 [Gammaproteobacteria bacterium]
MDIFELTVVIPAFKDNQQIKHCLQALNQGDFTDFNIVVVDHGESDDITQWITDDFPQVTCLRGSSDLWWTGATNIGIKYAMEMGSKLIMPLNHDCYVRSDTIANILKSSENVTNSIVAPVQFSLRDKNELICATSFFLLGFPTVIFPGKWCKSFSSGNLLSTGLIIGGRGAAIHAETFKAVGYFDEFALPHYGADHDFYLRCKKSGIKLLTCLDATVDVDDNELCQNNKHKSIPSHGYISTLLKRNSHRNIKDTYTLFSRYYPLPGLAILGMALYLIRYSLVYFLRFSRRILWPG